MIGNIKKLIVQGGFFEEETSLNLFEEEKNRISIIYGRNGSGKSSISKAFREYKIIKQKNDFFAAEEVVCGKIINTKQEMPTYDKIELRDFDDNVINFSGNDEKNCINVFDDFYISNNIKFATDGLKSIVMFGEQVGLDDKLNKIEIKKEETKNEFETQKEDLNKYSCTNGIDCPDSYIEQINRILKGENGWAIRDSTIKGNNRKSSVKSDFFSTLGEMEVIGTKADIELEFKETQERYDKVNNDNSKIEIYIDTVRLPYDDKFIANLLAIKIEEPKATEREKEILATIQGTYAERVDELKAVCSDENSTICPFCYQPISKEYKQHLLIEIKHILNKDVEEHKKELTGIYLPELKFDLEKFKLVDNDLVDKIFRLSESYNIKVNEYQTLINKKITKVFSPLIVPDKGLKESLNQINILIKELNKKKDEYNVNIEKKDSILNRLLELNNQIAHFEILYPYDQYLKRIALKKVSESKTKALEDLVNELESIESDLKSEKKNIILAVDKINKALKYIFFDEDRMSVEINKDLYYIKTFGRDVAIKDISVGECNILALCYFFCQILEHCDQGDEYSKQMLIIIDDPISSFDFENKIGIQSYLRYQMNKIIRGNTKSKIIIQSHEISAIFDFDKATKEIFGSIKKEDSTYKSNGRVLELSNKKLEDFRTNSRDEYSKLFFDIYQFASKSSGYENFDMVIGNEMRRLLEAYSTFAYKIGIEEISTDKNILNKLGDKKYEEYFENLMYRLVLHGGSHTGEKIRALSNENFYNFISLDEKVRTARDVLVFLYLLNKYHVKKHLQRCGNVEENILIWKSKIK